MSKKYSYVEEKAAVEVKREMLNILRNKYFNLWQSKFKIKKLDAMQFHYLFKHFWSDGTIIGLPIKHTEELIFCPYTTQKYNTYDYPEEFHVINKKNSPLLPKESKLLIRNKDACIGWAQSNHKPIKMIVEYYINEIVEVEMVIRTNLNAHKLPWLLIGAPEEKKKLDDLLNKILNNEASISIDVEDINNIQALQTNSEFIIDKLHAYKQTIESELLTYLGIDNTESDTSKQFMLVDQINSNNALINAYANDIEENIKAFFKDIKDTFNIDIEVETTQAKAMSVYEGQDQTSKPEHKEGGTNEN